MFHFNEQQILQKNLAMNHVIRSSPLQMFCKISVLKVFAKFTGKHLWWSLAFDKVAGWEISENSPGNTCACVSILVKLQAEKIHKTHKKTPVPPDFRFNKAAAGGTISTSWLWCTYIFHFAAYNKIEAFQGRRNFFFDLKLENCIVLRYDRFYLLYDLYHCKEKLWHFFNALRYLLPTSQSVLLL